MHKNISLIIKLTILTAVIAIIATACNNQDYVPKPTGYMRFDFPEKQYTQYKGDLPYTFEYPVYGQIKPDTDKDADPTWINIEFPNYHGKIHISYKRVNNNLAHYTEDARKLAYKHTVKADAIDESIIRNVNNKVFGTFYYIKGNAASSMQFYVTDSITNFIRGALYFSAQPNADSLAPSIEFFGKDVKHFIETLKWQKGK